MIPYYSFKKFFYALSLVLVILPSLYNTGIGVVNPLLVHFFLFVSGGIDHFLSLWDFLDKRFFVNLDEEHCSMFVRLKMDLVKYYLVTCFKAKNKVFFQNFRLFEFSPKYGKTAIQF